jgi:hypothetical protein
LPQGESEICFWVLERGWFFNNPPAAKPFPSRFLPIAVFTSFWNVAVDRREYKQPSKEDLEMEMDDKERKNTLD